ncbi:MAG: quinone-dependent dihydroorotate dehydrogenase [Pedobacter sp.]|nr:quinone-dependent dihydroorotate dehydrogenase [Chitinophagaceae bacterium]
MYHLLRDILFSFDPEAVHYLSMNSLQRLCGTDFGKKIISNSFCFNHSNLETNVFGLTFKNPVGLGAGFDKNALYLNELEALGFGFVEIGTVTPKPQFGNDKPRLFRLPKDKALINRMGFNNDGISIVRERLSKWNNRKLSTTNCKLIVGGNIGKNKLTPNEDAWKDYEICFTELFDCVDYFVVNVSSPNTPGLRELQEKASLQKILSHLQNINQSKAHPKPLLLKIAPDLTQEQLDDIVDLSFEVNLAGLVATNTTISRDNLQTNTQEINNIGAGGLSGRPLLQRSTAVVEYLNKQTFGKIPIIASGGIFTGLDAKEKLNAGATLVQVWTGFVYEGPSIVKRICKELI